MKSTILPGVLIPDRMPIFKLLERLREDKWLPAFIIGEFRSITCMVTINEAIETILEDIPTVNEVIRVLDIAQRGDGSNLLKDRYQPKNSKICRIWIANNN